MTERARGREGKNDKENDLEMDSQHWYQELETTDERKVLSLLLLAVTVFFLFTPVWRSHIAYFGYL